jgi:hypothetical protein
MIVTWAFTACAVLAAGACLRSGHDGAGINAPVQRDAKGTGAKETGKAASLDTAMSVLNTVWIGCEQMGAVNFLLEESGCTVELLYGTMWREFKAKEYDDVRMLRLRDPTTGKAFPGIICLYFRDGHLVAKCVVEDQTRLDDAAIYAREIASGRQHPLKDAALMQKVVWGKAVEPALVDTKANLKGGKVDGKTPNGPEAVEHVKVRCGIVVATPPSGGSHWNLLVLYQNAGSVRLDEKVYLPGFPIGPVLMVNAAFRAQEMTNGVVNTAGLYGVERRPMAGRKDMPKVPIVPFRLDPGEAVFVWLSLRNLERYKWVEAELKGMWAAGPSPHQGRILDAESAKVPLDDKGMPEAPKPRPSQRR